MAITVDTNNPAFSSVDGVLFDKSKTTLIQYPPAQTGTSYTIPNSVTTIGDGAFYNCNSPTSVIIGSGVTNIEDSAFSDCLSLTSVYFQGNAPSVGNTVFFYNARWPVFDPVTAYYLPGTIGWDAFATNTGIPPSVWQPQIQSTGTSLGVNSNFFGFNINWATGMTVVVEAGPSLSGGTWIPLATNKLATGSFIFTDSQWKNYPSRFYRVRSQ
jgi:hypothetical protein